MSHRQHEASLTQAVDHEEGKEEEEKEEKGEISQGESTHVAWPA